MELGASSPGLWCILPARICLADRIKLLAPARGQGYNWFVSRFQELEKNIGEPRWMYLVTSLCWCTCLVLNKFVSLLFSRSMIYIKEFISWCHITYPEWEEISLSWTEKLYAMWYVCFSSFHCQACILMHCYENIWLHMIDKVYRLQTCDAYCLRYNFSFKRCRIICNHQLKYSIFCESIRDMIILEEFRI